VKKRDDTAIPDSGSKRFNPVFGVTAKKRKRREIRYVPTFIEKNGAFSRPVP